MSNFTTSKFTTWLKQTLKQGEAANYIAYQDKYKNRIAVFANGDALVDNFNQNFSFAGGNGTWTTNGTLFNEKLNEKDVWAFGTDFPTYKLTSEALSTGATADKYLSRVDEAKDKLFTKFPELQQLEELAVSKRRRRRFAEDGDELCIDRYMSADPSCWMSMPRQDVQKKVARVYMDICVSAGTSAMTVNENVIGMLAMCDIIERAGISVEIIVGATSYGANKDAKNMNVSVIAKEAGEPLDVARLLSFALPGMFRQFIFGAWANITDSVADSGLGAVVCDLDHYMFDFFNADVKIQAANPYLGEQNVRLWVGAIKKMFNLETLEEAAA